MSLSITSASTYLRAFNTDSSIKKAIGDCEYTGKQKLARIIISVLTLGVGYGVMKLMDANISRNKIEQFCDCAPHIHDILSNAVLRGEREVTIPFSGGQKVTFSQHPHADTGRMMVMIFDGTHQGSIESSLESICLRLEHDFYTYPGCYRIEKKDHKSLSEKQAWKNGQENAQGSLPTPDEFINDSKSGTEATTKRLAAANAQFNQWYFDVSPEANTSNRRIRFQEE